MTTIQVGYTKPTPASVTKGLTTVVGPPGPPGPPGEQGLQGDPGVVVQADPPANHDVIWVVDT